MIQMMAAPNSATPTNSRTLRETVDRLTSNLHDDGQHKRAPSRPLAEKAPQFHPQLFLYQPLIRPFLDARLLHDLAQHARAVGEECLAVFHDEAARDDVRHPFERSGLFVDRDDGNDEPVLR